MISTLRRATPRRYIVAVFTPHTAGTRYPLACQRGTRLVKTIVPGA